jgi:hypothetical protein
VHQAGPEAIHFDFQNARHPILSFVFYYYYGRPSNFFSDATHDANFLDIKISYRKYIILILVTLDRRIFMTTMTHSVGG